MKALCIGFSLTGNNVFALKIISRELKCELEVLGPVKPYPPIRKGSVLGILSTAFRSFINPYPKLKPLKHDLNDFDLIVLGGPAWADSPSAPLKSFVRGNELDDKKVAVFMVNGTGSNVPLEKLVSSLESAGAEVVLGAVVKDALIREIIAGKAMSFAEQLKRL